MPKSMRRRIATAFAAILILAVAATRGRAQSPSSYFGIAGMYSTQEAGTPYQGSSGIKPGTGGSAFGIDAEWGGFVTRALSVSVELSLPARFEVVRSAGIPNERFDTHYRDVMVSVLVHAHTPRVGRVRAAAVGGAGFVRESAVFRTAFAPFGSNAYGPDGPEQMQANTTGGLVFGGDIELFVTKHVVIGPQMRVHWVNRADAPGDPMWSYALGSWLWRPALGLRIVY
jgi:hypothetical protein